MRKPVHSPEIVVVVVHSTRGHNLSVKLSDAGIDDSQVDVLVAVVVVVDIVDDVDVVVVVSL